MAPPMTPTPHTGSGQPAHLPSPHTSTHQNRLSYFAVQPNPRFSNQARPVPDSRLSPSPPTPVRTSSDRLSRPTARAAEMHQHSDEHGSFDGAQQVSLPNGSGSSSNGSPSNWSPSNELQSNPLWQEVMERFTRMYASKNLPPPSPAEIYAWLRRRLNVSPTVEAARNRDQQTVTAGPSHITAPDRHRSARPVPSQPSAQHQPPAPAPDSTPDYMGMISRSPSPEEHIFYGPQERVITPRAQYVEESRRPRPPTPPPQPPSIDPDHVQNISDIVKLGLQPHTSPTGRHPSSSTKQNTLFIFAAHDAWKLLVRHAPQAAGGLDHSLDFHIQRLHRRFADAEDAFHAFLPRYSARLKSAWAHLKQAALNSCGQETEEELSDQWVFITLAVLDAPARAWIDAKFPGRRAAPSWNDFAWALKESIDEAKPKLADDYVDGLTSARRVAERCLEQDENGRFYDDEGETYYGIVEE